MTIQIMILLLIFFPPKNDRKWQVTCMYVCHILSDLKSESLKRDSLFITRNKPWKTFKKGAHLSYLQYVLCLAIIYSKTCKK